MGQQVETCFFKGMDAYSKTWLQFVFPVYIWVIVGLIILASHFSRRFTKLLGNNPVSVLATLILLSYARILRSLIAAIYITYLDLFPFQTDPNSLFMQMTCCSFGPYPISVTTAV